MSISRFLTVWLLWFGLMGLSLFSPILAEELIPAEEARQRIQTHLDYINRRTQEMDARYGYGHAKSGRTLTEEFERQGAMRAKMYIDNWSGGVYMAWHHNVWPFYQYHTDQLKESLSHIKNGLARSDMQYLDNGMAAWKQFEPNVVREMQHNVELIAQGGKIISTVWDMKDEIDRASEGMKKTLNMRKNHFEASEEARLKALKAAHADRMEKIRNTHLFSAIGGQRIPLPPIVTRPMN